MLVRIRTISAKFTLLVYLASMLMAALFHYHDSSEGLTEESAITFDIQADNVEDTTVVQGEHCNLCKVASGHILPGNNSTSLIPNAFKKQILTSLIVVKELIIGSLSQRAPPVAV